LRGVLEGDEAMPRMRPTPQSEDCGYPPFLFCQRLLLIVTSDLRTRRNKNTHALLVSYWHYILIYLAERDN
jgi:hypothetical protein